MTLIYSGIEGGRGNCWAQPATLETKYLCIYLCLSLLNHSLLNLIPCSYRVIVVRLEHWVPLEPLGPQALLVLLAQLENKETEERL